MQRIEADLRDHYWYDELVNEGIRKLEELLALAAAFTRPSAPPRRPA